VNAEGFVTLMFESGETKEDLKLPMDDEEVLFNSLFD